jgi:aminoglycoside phosphotransferase (APT) family kinase protein
MRKESGSTEKAAVPGVDVVSVSRWIGDHTNMKAPFSYQPIPGGRSNPTYLVRDGHGDMIILRRPPLGQVLATAHDVSREYRIISALRSTEVPVPVALGFCDDLEVNGAPFYIMSFIDGQVVSDPSGATLGPGVDRSHIGQDLVDVLVALHAVDAEAVGLRDLGRRDAYIERQLRRWQRQLESQDDLGYASLRTIHDMLHKSVPPQQGCSVVHGDFRLGNVMLGPDGLVMAVLDWELATLGDPLADVGWLLHYWPGPADWTSDGLERGTVTPDVMTRADLLDHYAQRAGRDVTAIMFYVAFAQWRSACILSGVYARFKVGAMTVSDDAVGSINSTIEGLAQSAYGVLDRHM